MTRRSSHPSRTWRQFAGVTFGVVSAHLLVLALSLEGLGQRWRLPRWNPQPVQTWTVVTPQAASAKAAATARAAMPGVSKPQDSPTSVKSAVVAAAPLSVAAAATAGTRVQQPSSAAVQPVEAADSAEPSVRAPEAAPGPAAVLAPALASVAPVMEPASERLTGDGDPPGPPGPPGPPERPQGASAESHPDRQPGVAPEGSQSSPTATTPPIAEPAADAPPPVYRAQLPPPFLWRYTMRRGALSGSAELSFERSGVDYVMDLRGTVIGLEVLGQRSQGSTGTQGLEPTRFVERRMGRDRMSANFDRAKAQISYSGPTAVKPLLPGAQDRLSWMVQLGAVIAAEPELFSPGSVVLMSISGVRADVDTWAFQVQGFEPLSLPSGVVNRALRIFRQPRQPYDTQIDVWLDPQRHHLPVQARMTVLPSRDRLDLVLDP